MGLAAGSDVGFDASILASMEVGFTEVTGIQDSGRGEVYSFTTIYDPPAGYEENAPYTVALIKLEGGPMVTAQLTDLEDNQGAIGTPVEMVTRKLRSDGDERELLVYGYKFRPQALAAT